MDAYLKSPISKSLVIVVAVFEGLATFFVALRFHLRVKLKQGIKWDDWLVLLSLVASWGYAIAILVVAGQIGVDVVKVDPLTAAKKYVEAVAIGSILLIFVIVPVKISVLLFYKRIFVTQLFKRCVWITVGIVLAWGVASFVAQLLIADPVPSSAWVDIENPKYRFDYFKFGLSVPVLSVIFDGIILIFPLPCLRKLQIPTKRKVAIIATFWLGSFCLVTGAIRIYYWYKNAALVTDSNHPNVNKWEYDTLVQTWVFLEMNVSVIAACLPTLAPILTLSIYTRLIERIHSFPSLLRHGSSQEQFELKQRHKSSHQQRRHVDVTDVERARILPGHRDDYAAATQASLAEVDRTRPNGAGEEGFSMRHLPEDKETVDGHKNLPQEGIRKTTEINVSGLSANSSHGSHGSLDLGDAERDPRHAELF